MDAFPDKAVPGGCVIGLFGIGAWIYAGLCAYLLTRREAIEDPAEQAALVRELLTRGGIAFLLGTALVIVGFRLAVRADMTDPHQGPMIR